jgi:hypothetical protein
MYTVIVLIEQPMTAADAAEVASLHEGIEDTRHYHLLLPCENAATQVETAISALAASEVLAAPPVATSAEDVEATQRQIDHAAKNDLERSIAEMKVLGHQVTGEYTSQQPIDALDRVVKEHKADEVIVMTRPHVIAEFLHLDWTSKARRRLGVPILHLVEHEPLDAEAGAGEGVTGL